MDGEHATEIREQVQRLVSHPLLKNSRRCRSFLQYVVEETLEGRGTELKERTVGVAVFGRDLEYDTNLDHVVRTAASDLRRRLALYYQDSGSGELRICLPPGTYTPKFQAAENDVPVIAEPAAQMPATPAIRRPLYPLAALVVLLAVITVGAHRWPRDTNAIDHFWRPFLDAREPVLICAGTPFVPDALRQEANLYTFDFARYLRQAMPNLIAAGDTSTIAQVAGFLTAKGRKFRVRTQTDSELADLRNGPVVLIGAFNNAWSLPLTGQTRYALVWDTDRSVNRIKDRRNPSQETWETSAQEDYALITRAWDQATGHALLLAGGLTMAGTVAAGDFLSDPKLMEDLAAAAPEGWAWKNLQVVIATRVVGGESTPPRVKAIEMW